jgi:predicted enzyme related to lactoylglutathione lyase
MKKVPVLSVYVQEIEAARRFYCDLLGFAEKKWYGNAILILENEGSMIVLEEIRDGSTPRMVPSVQVDDIDSEFRRLKAQNTAIKHEAPVPFPVGRMFTVLDSSGNEIEIVQYEA